MSTSTTISTTFVGTSNPTGLSHSQSYFGPKMWSNSKTSFPINFPIMDGSAKVGWLKASANVNFDASVGFALPAWATSMTVQDGEVSADSMRLNFTSTDEVMAGIYVGALCTLRVTLSASLWIPPHATHHGLKPAWVSGEWSQQMGKELVIPFDVIPVLVDLVVTLAKKVPGLKKLMVIIPTGLLDHLQDYGHGLIQADGVKLYPSIPMKWDLIYLSRQLAEVGVSVLGNVVPAAGMLAVTALVEVGEAMVELEEQAGVCIGMGPEIEFIFPVHVKITKLVADDVVFEEISFDGRTITGTAPNGPLSFPVKRIGVQCTEAVEPLEFTFGIWANITFAKIFSKGSDAQFNLLDLAQTVLGFDLDLFPFKTSMTNEIGDPGYRSHTVIVKDDQGNDVPVTTNTVSPTIEVKFI